MKKLLTIIASALTLGAFAADNDITIQFVAPDGASAEKAYTVVETTTDTTVEADLDFGCLPYYIVATIAAEDYPTAGTYALAENGIILSESVPMAPMSAPRLAGLKLAAPTTQMYVNALAGDAKIEAGTYGSITVADPGIAATHFDATTAITDGTGTIANLFHKGSWGYINPHTLCAWFKVDALPESGDKTVYAMNTDGPWGNKGYRVAITSDGKIKIGHCHNGYEDWNTGYTMGVTDNVCVAADTWYYMTITLDRDTSIDGVASPTDVKIYLNGSLVLEEEDLFSADLGGNNFVGFAIGSGMTVAGLYVDTTVLDGTTADVLAYATSEDMVQPYVEHRTIYAKNTTEFVDSNGDAVELADGDIIVINDSHWTIGAWNANNDLTKFVGHKVVVDKHTNIGNGTVGVPEGMELVVQHKNADKTEGVYLRGEIKANAKISGEGVLFFGHTSQTSATINGGVIISCASGFQNGTCTATINGAVTLSELVGVGGTFKLTDGATLKVAAKLADKYTVTTDVEKKRVGYNESTKTYSLIQQREMTVRVVENTTRYYLNAKDENGTSTEKIAIDGNSVLIDNGTGFTAYYVANEGYELSKTAGGAKISSDKKMVWYYFSSVGADQNYDAQVTATAVTPTMPTEITGGSTEQQTAYVAWAADKNISDLTTKGISEAFALNLTAEKLADKTVEKAVKDELDELLKTIDTDESIDLLAIMQAVAAGTSDGAITLEGYENATIKLVPDTLGEGVTTDAKLFRLSVEFNAKGQS